MFYCFFAELIMQIFCAKEGRKKEKRNDICHENVIFLMLSGKIYYKVGLILRNCMVYVAHRQFVVVREMQVAVIFKQSFPCNFLKRKPVYKPECWFIDNFFSFIIAATNRRITKKNVIHAQTGKTGVSPLA